MNSVMSSELSGGRRRSSTEKLKRGMSTVTSGVTSGVSRVAQGVRSSAKMLQRSLSRGSNSDKPEKEQENTVGKTRSKKGRSRSPRSPRSPRSRTSTAGKAFAVVESGAMTAAHMAGSIANVLPASVSPKPSRKQKKVKPPEAALNDQEDGWGEEIPDTGKSKRRNRSR